MNSVVTSLASGPGSFATNELQVKLVTCVTLSEFHNLLVLTAVFIEVSFRGEGRGEVAQSCPTLCDPMDCSLPGSSVHGILQARILEWVAVSFSRGSS